jgi:predicted dehydrogenase
VLEMADGAIATLSVTLGSPEPRSRLRIVCQNVTMTSGGPPIAIASEPWSFIPPPERGQEWLDAALQGAPQGQEGFVEQFARFHATLETGAALPVTIAEARASLELATAIYHSSRTGHRVTLPLAPDHPAYGGWAADLRR